MTERHAKSVGGAKKVRFQNLVWSENVYRWSGACKKSYIKETLYQQKD